MDRRELLEGVGAAAAAMAVGSAHASAGATAPGCDAPGFANSPSHGTRCTAAPGPTEVVIAEYEGGAFASACGCARVAAK